MPSPSWSRSWDRPGVADLLDLPLPEAEADLVGLARLAGKFLGRIAVYSAVHILNGPGVIAASAEAFREAFERELPACPLALEVEGVVDVE